MQIKKFKYNTELFVFSLVFLLTVIAWIVVEIYHLEKNKKFSVEYQTGMTMTIEQLPSLDLLNNLKNKQ
jgi:hypothetical protein